MILYITDQFSKNNQQTLKNVTLKLTETNITHHNHKREKPE